MNIREEIMSVVGIKSETNTIKTIILRGGVDSVFINRKPGQFVMVSLRDENDIWCTPHPFTISNEPGNEIIWLTIRRSGSFTNRFLSLRPEEEVKVKGPFGNFCTAIEKSNSTVMIAGGIGITPFLSILRHYHGKKPGLNKVTLFWANPVPDDYFSLTKLDTYYYFMDFRAVLVSERQFLPKHLKKHRFSSLNFERGLLAANVMKKYAEIHNSNIYICGSTAMQDYVLDQLHQCGVNEERIETEKFGR